jgi:uncharacterized RDD family membrane protein YckC
MKTTIKKMRLIALVIDFFILSIIELLIVILLLININKNFLFIYGMATAMVYSLFFCKDIIKGQSIGKKIIGLQVVNKKRLPATLGNLILRNFIALLQPIDALYMLNNNGKRLGDIISKTRVISTSTNKIDYRQSSIKIFIFFVSVCLVTFSFFYLILWGTKNI